jgi:hypothetical protein
MSDQDINRQHTFYGASAEYIQFEGVEALLDSGAGTGKSFCAMVKADITARKYPGSRQLFARQTRKSMNDTVLPDWRERVLFKGHPAISKTSGIPHQELYTYPNGSTVALGGLAEPDRILSSQYDRIVIFQAEETELEVYEKLISRLRAGHTPYHQITLDVNPGSQYHWINQRYDVDKLTEQRQRFFFKHQDNPAWYDHERDEWTQDGINYIKLALGSLTGIRRERLLFHRWIAEEGVILENYDPSIHLLSGELEFSQDHGTWFLHVHGWNEPVRVSYFTAGVDWGWDPDPGVISVWAYDSPKWHNDIRRFKVAEIYKTKWQKEQWAEAAEELWAKYEIKQFYCDRSNPEAINQLNLRLGKLMGGKAPAIAVKHPVIGGGHRSDIANGIDVMREGLRNAVSGHIRTFIVRDSLLHGRDEGLAKKGRPTCTEQEVLSWVYQKNEEGKPNKEKPEPTCDDHGMDAWRYDEIGNFLHGKGHKPRAEEGPKPGTYGEMYDRMLKRKREKLNRKKKYSWQQ